MCRLIVQTSCPYTLQLARRDNSCAWRMIIRCIFITTKRILRLRKHEMKVLMYFGSSNNLGSAFFVRNILRYGWLENCHLPCLGLHCIIVVVRLAYHTWKTATGSCNAFPLGLPAVSSPHAWETYHRTSLGITGSPCDNHHQNVLHKTHGEHQRMKYLKSPVHS